MSTQYTPTNRKKCLNVWASSALGEYGIGMTNGSSKDAINIYLKVVKYNGCHSDHDMSVVAMRGDLTGSEKARSRDTAQVAASRWPLNDEQRLLWARKPKTVLAGRAFT